MGAALHKIDTNLKSNWLLLADPAPLPLSNLFLIIIIFTIIIITIDPPLRSDRFTPMENKVKLVQMLLSIVINLSK